MDVLHPMPAMLTPVPLVQFHWRVKVSVARVLRDLSALIRLRRFDGLAAWGDTQPVA